MFFEYFLYDLIFSLSLQRKKRILSEVFFLLRNLKITSLFGGVISNCG